jgi:hypothetical protein
VALASMCALPQAAQTEQVIRMLGFMYESWTRRTSVTTLGGRGMTWVERPVLKDAWFIVGIVLGCLALLGALALILTATYVKNHDGNWLLPFGGAIAIMIIFILAVLPWWRWKIQRQARRQERKNAA